MATHGKQRYSCEGHALFDELANAIADFCDLGFGGGALVPVTACHAVLVVGLGV